MTSPPKPRPAPELAIRPEPCRKVAIEQLLGPGRELVIVHNGREYRLRLTRNDKLILTA